MKKPFLLFWGGLGLVLLFAWIYLPAISRYQDLKTRQDGMDIQTRDLEAKIKELREERDLLKNDPGYLEKVIREELGLVKPGEIVYKFVEEKPQPLPSPAKDLLAEGTVLPPVEKKTIASVTAPVKPGGIVVPALKVTEVKKTGEAVQKKVESAIVPSASPKPIASVESAYPRRETR